ncbi:Alpha-2-macroglobulin [Thermoflexales bacterium]|nr:Alpha-2-macroglobulin [Thermoflexales bacterium]
MATANPPRPSNRLPVILVALVAVIGLIAAGVFLLTRNQQDQIVKNLVAKLPPFVIDRAPARGEEQGTEAPITLSFDKPMNRASVEQSFQITPKISGAFKWNDDNTQVAFVPTGQGFARGEIYNVNVLTTALAANGQMLGQPLEFTFKAVGFLDVTQVMPTDGTEGVGTDTDITVMFNRPVVPLVPIEQQATLPQPLVIDPPVKGQGEWINTSIYVFRPDERLQAGIQYTAKIAAGLQDPLGAALREDLVWSFTTMTPQVIANGPSEGETDVWLDRSLQVVFSQPMDHANVESLFSLHQGSPDGPQVQGTFTWVTSTVMGGDMPMGMNGSIMAAPLPGGGPARALLGETLTFTPTNLLERETVYFARLASGAQGASGGLPMPADYVWSFTTVKPLYVIRTDPANGSSAAPYASMDIFFSAPVDEKTLQYVTTSAEISPTQVYTYYSDWDKRYVYGFGPGPSGDYQVTVGAQLADRWGQQLGSDQVINFRTRPLAPEQWFDVPGRFGVYSNYTDTVIYVRYRNVSQLNFDLYQVPQNEFAYLIGPNSYSRWDIPVPVGSPPVRSWSVPVDKPLNTAGLIRIPMESDTGGVLPTGIYLIRVTSPEQSQNDFGGTTRHLLVVADNNITLKAADKEGLAWVTHLQSGQETPNVPIHIYDPDFKQLSAGTTDPAGLFKYDLTAQRDPNISLMAVVGDYGGPFGVAVSDWNNGIGPWDFGVYANYYASAYNAYLYTDKPIYRPGQTVHIKGIMRVEDDARYAIDPNLKSIDILIYDSQGKQVYTGTQALNDYGTFSFDFALDGEAALGGYSIQAQIPVTRPGQDMPSVQYYNGTFVVAEYRRPEFQVSVTAVKDEVLQGETVEVEVEATYFFGGAVGEAPVNWSATASDYYFDRYSGPGYYGWNDIDYSGLYDDSRGGLIASGEGKTDAQGKLKISLPAKLDEKAGSQVFNVEAAVTDLNGQYVANRVRVIVHQGEYYIGVAPVDYVGTVGQPLDFNLLTVDWQGAALGSKNLDVVFHQREWYNVQEQDDFGNIMWTWSFSDTAVFTATATSGPDGMGTTSFIPPAGGEYRVVARGTDDRGNKISTSTYVWVSSREYVSWRQDNNDRISLVADKKEYTPGDVAKILIPSPYQGQVRALVTTERGRILDQQVITLQTNSDVIEIPITPAMAPNAFVSVVIVKGVDQNDLAPSFKMGYASFKVNRAQQELTIDLTPDRDPHTAHYAPRDTVTYTVKIENYAGEPQQAETSLAMVDLAVLSLLDRLQLPIAEQFYGERGLGIRTGVALVFSVDRINVKLAAEAKGGGGGAEAAGGFTVRGDFRDTAYWKADVTTDANGLATVSFTLPDNLTTWRMSAIAITKDGLVGEGQSEVRSTKDLLIRPVTPRFMVVGDQFNLAAVVNNNTANDIAADVSLEGTGITIVNGQVKQNVSVPAGGAVRVEWPVTVLDAAYADLTFSVRGGGLSDASKPTAGLPPEQYLPIYKYSTPDTTATSGNVTQEDPVRNEVIVLPKVIDVTQGELKVQIDPSLAAGSTEGLNYLEHYPYECTEQTVSRFLPNVLTYRALRELNLADAALQERLERLVRFGLQRLTNQQHVDGGWGWWVDEKSNVQTSTYVVFGLIKARQAGFPIDQNVLDRGVQYLINNVQATTGIDTPWRANQQAYLLYVLADAGKPQTSALISLYDDKRVLLSNYGKALLALGLNIAQPAEKSRINTLMSDIVSQAKTSATGVHWEEKDLYWGSWETDVRSTATVLDAFAILDPKNQLAPNVVRWLMNSRVEGRWPSTQDTAWTLIGFTDWMVATGELTPDYSWALKLNETVIGSATATQDNVRQSVVITKPIAELNVPANVLAFERKAAEGQAGDGMMYYSAYLRAYQPVTGVQSLARGIVIGRQYYDQSDACFKPLKLGEKAIPCTPVTKAQVGDTLVVKLSIVAPTDLHYVLVESPLPAGMEAVDTSLKTTSQIAEGPEFGPVNQPYTYHGGWGWWWFTHTELRDEKVALFASYLPKGTYEYTYQIRAGLDGTYNVLPARAEQMYFPEVFGRSDGAQFVIEK